MHHIPSIACRGLQPGPLIEQRRFVEQLCERAGGTGAHLWCVCALQRHAFLVAMGQPDVGALQRHGMSSCQGRTGLGWLAKCSACDGPAVAHRHLHSPLPVHGLYLSACSGREPLRERRCPRRQDVRCSNLLSSSLLVWQPVQRWAVC